MKTIKIFIFCMIAVLFVQGQNVPPHTLSEVEVIPPKFTAVKSDNWQNVASINEYIANNFKNPESPAFKQEGTEVVQFVIGKLGDVSDITIINSVSKAIDEEIIQLIKDTDHMWMPGQNNGVPVAMEKEIAIMIKAGATERTAVNRDFTKIARNYFSKGSEKLLIKQKPRTAMHQFQTAHRYRPYDKSVLFMLALCKMELGKSESAYKDLARIKKLGGITKVVPEEFAQHTSKLKSYNELMEYMAAKETE